MFNPLADPLYEPLDNLKPETYMIDLAWFDKIHCRRPMYICINFIEYYILDSENEIIDSIKITSEPVAPGIYPVDKETYEKIKRYMKV